MVLPLLILGAAALQAGGAIYGAITEAQSAKEAGKLGVASAMLEAKVAKKNYKFEAAAHKFNAEVARQQAANTRGVGRADANDYRRLNSARLASNRAAAAGSGIVASSGSPLMVDEAIFSEIEFGAARTINAAEIIATRQDNEGVLLDAQARQARKNAMLAMKSGAINAQAARIGADAAQNAAIARGIQGVGSSLATAASGFR